jgi:hypothetical protein
MIYTKHNLYYPYYNNHPYLNKVRKYWCRQNIGVHKISTKYHVNQIIGVDEKLGVYKIIVVDKIIAVDEKLGVNEKLGVYKIIGVNRKLGTSKNSAPANIGADKTWRLQNVGAGVENLLTVRLARIRSC